jgi:phosphatidate cytidylyltransferase
MKRVLTAAVGAPLALWATFGLPPTWFFAVISVVFCLAAWEYGRIQRHWAAGSPLWLVVPLVPLVGLVVRWGAGPWNGAALVAGLAALVGVCVLAARPPVREGAPAMGALAFGALYLGLPLAALSEIQERDAWLLFHLFAIVWLGDAAALYLGTRFGRHRLAPVVSPNKSWEGALAALATAGLATLVFTRWHGGAIDWRLVGLALPTSVAAQLGDLLESSIKRGAGVKDSGALLPGHGGVLDRIDALLLATPFWWLVLEWGGRLPATP